MVKVYLSVRPVCPAICWYGRVSVCPSVCRSAYMSVRLSIYPLVGPFVHLFFRLSIISSDTETDTD